jgi:ectoine hydroxylase-related dioxygenase (phytanoyl-CoA dioxygenase family)
MRAIAWFRQLRGCDKLIPVFNRIAQSVEEGGFAIVSQCLSEQMVEHLCADLGNTKHAQRNLLDISIVRELAVSESVKQLVTACLGKECFAVRGILFNKTPDSNWKVAWHQDRTIAVRERKDVAAFGPWSVKAGVPSVQPPSSIMAKMLAIRLHLDESHENNGPLRVIPGSHKVGCLSMEEVASWRERPSFVCTVPRGGAILMRPLLVHASSSCSKPEPRRVIHLEFAAENLPGGLEWRDRV